MNKILFFDAKEKNEFISSLQEQLKIKNRLLGMIISNPERKTSVHESSNKAFKYEDQIIMLEKMHTFCMNIRVREDIQKLNAMIDSYNAIQ